MKVGITFSTFDLFHAGHVKMLESLVTSTRKRTLQEEFIAKKKELRSITILEITGFPRVN